MLETQIKGRAVLPPNERSVRSWSVGGTFITSKCLPQSDMVTWLMDRPSDPRSIVSAFIFVDIAANNTLVVVCGWYFTERVPRFLTYVRPDLTSSAILHDAVSTVPYNTKGGGSTGDRRMWMDERCVGVIIKTQQLHPRATKTIPLASWKSSFLPSLLCTNI